MDMTQTIQVITESVLRAVRSSEPTSRQSVESPTRSREVDMSFDGSADGYNTERDD